MIEGRRTLLKPILLFSIAFAGASLLFGLLSWGRASAGPPPEMLRYLAGGVLDLVEHAALGALAALPTRRKLPIALCALGAVLIDVDHLGYVLGLPVQGRASHSLAFAVVGFAMFFMLARKGLFGRRIEPFLLASVALASVAAHLAWDAIDGGASFPLWMPFSTRPVYVSPLVGVLLEAAAIVLVWAVTAALRKRTTP